eukprot:CAMPEP_0175434718 /NCGR_PEP_ID=MMETSP0095-20121207/54048_1 /TAXON_ID=311494 /ORGANISM="Alexandrium monilatum, Strain CCMP3105" /LENGTH=124 /DNA_ID=CAMNT_0016734267 /DNA_START=1 /DNA_END=372 /DNA_ORIENTATION=-
MMLYARRGNFLAAVQSHINNISRSEPKSVASGDDQASSCLASILPQTRQKDVKVIPLSQAAQDEVRRSRSEGTTAALQERLNEELHGLAHLADCENDRLGVLRRQRECLMRRSERTQTALKETR